MQSHGNSIRDLEKVSAGPALLSSLCLTTSAPSYTIINLLRFGLETAERLVVKRNDFHNLRIFSYQIKPETVRVAPRMQLSKNFIQGVSPRALA